MIKNNKIISLTIIGLVVGLILAMLAGSGQNNAFIFVPFGGIVGFLAGMVLEYSLRRSQEVDCRRSCGGIT